MFAKFAGLQGRRANLCVVSPRCAKILRQIAVCSKDVQFENTDARTA